MTMSKLRTTFSALACACLSLAVVCGASAADRPQKRAESVIPPLNLGSMADAMNPMNPFNGGAEPLAMPGDSRLVVFTYSRDQIFRVLTAPLKGTTIEFPDDEQIASEPAWGDSLRWESSTDNGNHLYIKPHAAGLVNTLSVTTNKRTYEFTLVSSPLGGIFYQKVRFRIPEAVLPKIKARADGEAREPGERPANTVGVSPDKLNFDYSTSGSADFKPDAVFDDGKFIWMRMPATASEWPVALVKDGSDYVVANFIRRGDYLVLQRLADVVALRSGSTEVTVRRGRGRFLGLF
ncbi:TrbG/VirB9 family P-type conjugative transfer protein [Ralstonia solanacearum]|uniref:TrbG/VirB9 family P-type conjugative transfer protein n=1 Tax=Ralstonia solanacearum TaxID=305 RepID=UPI0005C5D5CC|nr:TrbG/VirB9 family P-type conjugative transfer protein [Ralstonia solanacearum]MBB6592740.1 TrbG/VirB9 family P-type conjugative transfer protein [Ralstonia solanacearum]MBB6596962.1 TrbG/VirB9 family P-type conjugative transfer protein [Ralstonia solanacearum]MDB0541206.1 TrbG/VirB9 family P-type conjugative transfer protein [Ralstonia solanacearum]MDB0551420.1 TrbG/VirB9 family P-type conjugative transfer protein [Ralstonia solanacearum]MDB0556155.1 TrbG/VirB9 family P-type conjugative tra